MEGYGRETYGERWADIYDELFGADPADAGTAEAVDLLAALADGGPVLELGVGTGRIALPLAARGLEVHGIDASARMLALLGAKPGGERVHTHVGDLADADVDVPGGFALVLVVFNTLFALPTQEAQVRCFANVARRLAPAGAFVVEAFVPDPSRFDRGQTVRASRVGVDGVGLEVSRHDPVAQSVSSQQVWLTEAGAQLRPVSVRYAWPSELDLMARLAGLELRDRWGGWDRSPFTAESGGHVSVYTHPA